MLGSKARAQRIARIVERAYGLATYVNDLNNSAQRVPGDRNRRNWTSMEDTLRAYLPKSYRYLGSGASRDAILAGGHVYKVSLRSPYQNESEAAAYAALKHVVHPTVRIAETYSITPKVNVAEYVEGSGAYDTVEGIRDFSQLVRREKWYASDVYGDNVRVTPDGKAVIVDLGCFSPEPADD
jgi:hypothetical protein